MEANMYQHLVNDSAMHYLYPFLERGLDAGWRIILAHEKGQDYLCFSIKTNGILKEIYREPVSNAEDDFRKMLITFAGIGIKALYAEAERSGVTGPTGSAPRMWEPDLDIGHVVRGNGDLIRLYNNGRERLNGKDCQRLINLVRNEKLADDKISDLDIMEQLVKLWKRHVIMDINNSKKKRDFFEKFSDEIKAATDKKPSNKGLTNLSNCVAGWWTDEAYPKQKALELIDYYWVWKEHTKT